MSPKENTTKVSIELYSAPYSGLQFCMDFLIVYGLRGESVVAVGNERYTLRKGGILTISQFQRHEIHCEEGAGLSILHIPPAVLRIMDGGESTVSVHCYVRSDDAGAQEHYHPLRVKYAHIFQLLFGGTPQGELLAVSYVSQLMSMLTSQFLVRSSVKRAKHDASAFARCDRIMRFIHEHWQEEISIEIIAKREYISTGYLSRFFRDNMGMTFTEYLTDLRLQHAVRELERSQDTVTQIALSNGFRNVNSFIHYFKLHYGMTPGQFRERSGAPSRQNTDGARTVPDADGIRDLLEYAEENEPAMTVPAIAAEHRTVSVDAAVKGHRIRHTWRRLLNIGYAKEGLLAEVQKQLRKAQEEIGFEYVRFHGILDDDMHVCFHDEQGRIYMDYSRIDLLLDFVISIGFKPYVEFSYMPRILAAEATPMFDRASYISTFNSEENWRTLICDFMQHCIERYGRKNVREWRFTTIDINSAAAGFMFLSDYLHLYQVTYDCVKSTDELLQFGGPGGFIFNAFSGTLVRHFLEFVLAEHCVPDFICTQCYPHDEISLTDDFWRYTMTQSSSPAILSTDIHFMRRALYAYRGLLTQYGLQDLPIWVEQWNSTVWQRDLSGDTCYKAAWLAMNICENMDETDSFGYWSFSDFMEEISDFGGVYHGGYGLFTYNGIPKSGWHALRFLRMLGESRLAAGDGWFASRNEKGIQILLHHYCHYDYLYCLRYRKLTDPQKAYSVFTESGPVIYDILIRNLAQGTYEMRKYTITPAHGSSFDTWVAMGMPLYLSAEERTYIERVSQPFYQVETVRVTEELSIECTLNAHEVQIITLNIINI